MDKMLSFLFVGSSVLFVVLTVGRFSFAETLSLVLAASLAHLIALQTTFSASSLGARCESAIKCTFGHVDEEVCPQQLPCGGGVRTGNAAGLSQHGDRD